MKSYRFVISRRSDDPLITNVSFLEKPPTMIEDHFLDDILNKFKFHDLYLISQSGFKTMKRIWTDKDADIILISHDKVKDLIDYELNEVFYFVDDEKFLAEDVISLYMNSKFISLKFRHFSTYDKIELMKQFEILSQFIIESYKMGFIKNIDQLTGFAFTEKFDLFGNGSFFISPDLKVYSHPNFYYQDSKHGLITHNILSFDEDDENNTHYTSPHMLCRTCECFYCDRNIYFNKIETSEYKVPSFEECNKTTFLSRYSKKIFNSIQDSFHLDENLDLDRCNKKIAAENEISKLENNEVMTNFIKKIDLNYIKGDVI